MAMTNDQQLASPSGITMDYLAEMIRSEIREVESRMIKRWYNMDSRLKRLNDMESRKIKRLNAAVPEDLATIDIQEAVR